MTNERLHEYVLASQFSGHCPQITSIFVIHFYKTNVAMTKGEQKVEIK